jgi:hypothetical protein
MIVLAGEIIFCLIVVLFIGLITGWCLRGVQARKRLNDLENVYRINLASLESGKPLSDL